MDTTTVGASTKKEAAAAAGSAESWLVVLGSVVAAGGPSGGEDGVLFTFAGLESLRKEHRQAKHERTLVQNNVRATGGHFLLVLGL